MPIVQSYGTLTATRASRPTLYTGSSNYDTPSSFGYGSAYATIYATQPAVRTCVDFLARNIAQLGLHVFRRVSDTDRERLTDHPIADWIEHPNPSTTRYRLIESLIGDLALYFNAYLLKVRGLTNGRIGLVRIPPHEMRVEGGLLPSTFIWCINGQEMPIPTTEVVYFNGYNPLNALMGLSPMETLRQILAQEQAAADHRERYWRNASRHEGVIERPKDAPRWTPQQKSDWRTQWSTRFSGPQSTGQVPVLEDGMTYKATSFSPRDSEYSTARKLTYEEVAREYHIPLPMVGILEHATFSNIKEQHKQLYADCLGPWLEMGQEGFELQLVPEARDDGAPIYLEFNIAEKLKGSFEEQANALRVAVGRPFMTPNEGRARLNLPRITDDPSADQLAAQQGGPAYRDVGSADLSASETQAASASIVRTHLQRQASQVARVPLAQRADTFRQGRDRWVTELAADLAPIVGVNPARGYALLVTDHTYALLCDGVDAFTDDREVPYVW